jgi:hypothetical protein
VTQIGVVALSLILGRMLHEDEFIAHGADLVASAKAIAPKGGQEPLPAGLRNWLGRALQLDARHSFRVGARGARRARESRGRATRRTHRCR